MLQDLRVLLVHLHLLLAYLILLGLYLFVQVIQLVYVILRHLLEWKTLVLLSIASVIHLSWREAIALSARTWHCTGINLMEYVHVLGSTVIMVVKQVLTVVPLRTRQVTEIQNYLSMIRTYLLFTILLGWLSGVIDQTLVWQSVDGVVIGVH